MAHKVVTFRCGDTALKRLVNMSKKEKISQGSVVREGLAIRHIFKKQEALGFDKVILENSETGVQKEVIILLT